MRILHIINSLEDGGTENTLYKICKNDISNKHIVISLTDHGKYFSLINKLGTKIYCINIKFYSIIKFYRLIRLINFLNPDVIQTWLPHADLIGGVASKFAGIERVIWNIRYSNLVNGVVKFRTILLIKILSKLSHIIPKKIIVNSKIALKNCKNLGYDNGKLSLIHNGYDLSIFKPYKNKHYIRNKFKIDKNIDILGMVARYDPTKDHENLLKALSILKKTNTKFLCVLIGFNINNKNIIKKINELQLRNYVKLIDKRKDIFKYMTAMDVHILSSKTESFPNVVAEAMACATPCVVTNVGDAVLIIGKTGWIASPENPVELANAIEKALIDKSKNNWKKRCNQARLRIKNNFDIIKMIKSYNLIWSNVSRKKTLK